MEDMASLYHWHHLEYDEDLPYWLGLAEQHGGPILELGCGTGRVTVPLAQAGYSVVGLDNDPDMLTFAQQQAEQAGVTVQWQLADLADFSFPAPFPLIILPCNTYSALTAVQRERAAACIFTHLAPGGVFAVSLPNPDWLAQQPPEADSEVELTFAHPDTGNPVQVSSSWRRQAEIFEITWLYDQILPDGAVNRASQTVAHDISSPQTYLQTLQKQGFSVKKYGDFNKADYNKEELYLIIEAKKA